ncbi:MAG: rhodanese-like domain-containing protein [Bacteroidaceae bacterium]|nr:rhodanese-like domain-containing protein [Bacteroidaceae bacterium]MBP3786371.1 rhodanese-like domain-containing protein [Bacteroidaceae bacterium]
MKKMLTMLMSVFGLSFYTSCGQDHFENANVADFARYIEQSHVQLLDARTDSEYVAGHIAGAHNISVLDSDFIDRATAQFDKTRPIAVYCKTGRRSARAASMLTKAGYEVVNLEGGITAWLESGQPAQK